MSMFDRERLNRELSEGLLEIARRIEEVDGVVPLKPGEIRSTDYYMFGPYSLGRKPLWRSERKKKKAE
jgi:hypothetical protein